MGCAIFGFDFFFLSLSLSLHAQGATGPGTCSLDGEEDEGRGGHPRGSAHPGLDDGQEDAECRGQEVNNYVHVEFVERGGAELWLK